MNNCTENVSKNKRIAICDKNSSSLTVINSEFEVYKTKIDGCLINSSEKRCDYKLDVTKQSEKIIYYIELKGTDYTKAIEQIYNTVCSFPKRGKKMGLIILSRARNINISSSKASLFKKKLIEKHNLSIKQKSSPAVYCLQKDKFID